VIATIKLPRSTTGKTERHAGLPYGCRLWCGRGKPLLCAAAATHAGAEFWHLPEYSGLIVTMTQLGYVIGLALIVPLGDLLERRRLIAVVSAGTAVALAGAAVSPGIGSFLIACLAIGLTAW